MKNLMLLIILTITNSYCQDKNFTFEKLPQTLPDLEVLNKKDSLVKIYIIDIPQLENLVKTSKKKYKIVYFFSPTCHSSTGTLPKIIDYISNNNASFDLFAISGLRYEKAPSIVAYLKEMNYYFPTYIIDTEKYGNNAEPFRRLDLISTQMCPNCKVKKMGFSAFFVLNADDIEIANTNFEVCKTDEERLEVLKKLPLQ